MVVGDKSGGRDRGQQDYRGLGRRRQRVVEVMEIEVFRLKDMQEGNYRVWGLFDLKEDVQGVLG